MKNIILAIALVLMVGFFVWLMFEKSHSSDLTRNLNRVRTQLTQSQSDLDESRQAAAGLRSAQYRFQEQIRTLQGNQDRLGRELESAKREIETAQSTRRSLQDRLRESEAQGQAREQALANELESLRRSLAASEAWVGELESEAQHRPVQVGNEELAVVERRAEEAAQARLEAENKVAALEAELARLKTDRQGDLARATAQCQAEAARLAASLKEAEERIKHLERELTRVSALTTEAEKLRQSESAARAAADRLKGEAESLRQALTKAEEKVRAVNISSAPTVETEYWKREAQSARVSLAETNGKVKTLEEESVKELEELSTARQEIERLRTQLDRVETGLPDEVQAPQGRPGQPAANLEIREEHRQLVENLRSHIGSQDLLINSLRHELSLTFQDRVFSPLAAPPSAPTVPGFWIKWPPLFEM